MATTTAPAPRPVRPRRAGRGGLGGLLPLGAALALTAALGVLYAACVRTTRGQSAENALHDLAVTTPDGNGVAWLQRTFDVVGRFEPQHLAWGAGLVVVLAVVRLRPGRAVTGLLVAGLTLGVTELLKLVVLDRPDLSATYGPIANSLPSGHTSAVLGIALGAVLAAPRGLRPLVALLGAAAAGGMGAFVVDDGWHRVSDVLASALVAAACWCLVLALPQRGARPAGALAGLALGVPVLGALALALVYAGELGLPGTGFTTAVVAPGAVCALTVLLAARTLPRGA